MGRVRRYNMVVTPAHEQIVDFILAGKTPQEVIAFTASERAMQRVTDLIRRETGEGLGPAEKSELDTYMQLEHLIRLAKARAHQMLKR
jgi:hypothetical protein